MNNTTISDEKQKKIHERVRALILQSNDKITQNLTIETGRIADTRLEKIQTFDGAGGKTYVIEARLSTSLAGEIDGGIVIKFAKDLDSEVENAKKTRKDTYIPSRGLEELEKKP